MAYVGHLNGNISRLPFALPGFGPPAARPSAGQPENILLAGSDSRAGLTARQLQRAHTTYDGGGGSDTLMLAHVSPARDKVQVVSIPRDTYVEVPGHGRSKINAAYDLGGPGLLVQTVEQLTGLQVDHYVGVGFVGFQDIVDELGGVDVCLTEPAADHDAGLYLAAGRHHVDGETALAFARARKTVPGGDLGRIGRQQQLLGAVVRKLTSAGTLTDPSRLNDVLNTATRSLTVDRDLSLAHLVQLGQRLGQAGPGRLEFTTLPEGADTVIQPSGADVLLPDVKADAALFAALKADVEPGTPLPGPGPAGPGRLPPPVPPSQVQLTVSNGSGVAGAAGSAGRQLAALGFRVLGSPGNARTDPAQSTVFYGPGERDAAVTLQDAVPGSVLAPDPTLGGAVRLVIGAGYTGVVDPATGTPAGPPAPMSRSSPTPAPSPPPVVSAAQNLCST